MLLVEYTTRKNMGFLENSHVNMHIVKHTNDISINNVDLDTGFTSSQMKKKEGEL